MTDFDSSPSSEVATPPATHDERASYEALYMTHYAAVVVVLTRMLGGHEAAEDAAQTAFMKVWTNWSRMVGLTPASQKKYLYAVCRNTATDELRHRWNHPCGEPLSLDKPLRNMGGDTGVETVLSLSGIVADPDPTVDPERVTLGRAALEDALSSIGRRSPRAIEMLLFAHGYTSEEIATILRIHARNEAVSPLCPSPTPRPAHHHRARACSTSNNNMRIRRMRTRQHIRANSKD